MKTLHTPAVPGWYNEYQKRDRQQARQTSSPEETMTKHVFIVFVAAVLVVLAPAVHPAGASQQELNKKIVKEFYDLAINKKDFEAASKYLGPQYIQHNQRAADGAEGLKNFIQFLRAKFPDAHSEIKQIFADGDYVILHVHAVREPGTRGVAIVDIFRLQDGRIVEHWDVHEDILEKAANQNGMF
jgi:predicted SnoaL-like aldol condensation-catalyzing enzyme